MDFSSHDFVRQTISGRGPASPLPRQLRHDLIDRLVCDHHHLFIRSVLNRMLGENRRGIETQ